MSELRWILVVFGIVLLAGIYAWGRRGNRQSAGSEDALRVRPEPRLAPRDVEPASYDRSFEPQDEEDVAAEDADEFIDSPAVDAPSITASKPVARDAGSFATPASVKGADYASDSSSSGYSRDASPVRSTSVRPSPVRRGRVEPTFHDDDDAALTEELPASEPPAAAPAASMDAPTLAMSDTPPPRRIERRKIIALRLAAASDRFVGQQLREALEAESLQHGKYSVFHRLHDDGASVFSIASMVEPGTFDLEQMGTARYPGVTLFAQLPGPVAGVEALQELVACGKRLQASLGGTLQDERGVPLTVHRIERLRQEIQDFEHAPGRDSGRDPAHRHPSAPSS